MNRMLILCGGALAGLSLVGPVFANSANPTKEPSTQTPPPAAKAAPKTAAARHVTGEVVSVNQNAKTVTVKHGPKGKELTFGVEAGAAGQLSDLKAGDHVKIGYVRSHDHLMAKDIVKNEVAKAK